MNVINGWLLVHNNTAYYAGELQWTFDINKAHVFTRFDEANAMAITLNAATNKLNDFSVIKAPTQPQLNKINIVNVGSKKTPKHEH